MALCFALKIELCNIARGNDFYDFRITATCSRFLTNKCLKTHNFIAVKRSENMFSGKKELVRC